MLVLGEFGESVSAMAPIVLAGFLALCLTAAAVMVWSGYVLSLLWGWFLVPTFGFPVLSIPAAIGLALIVRYLTAHKTDVTKDKTKDERIAEWGVAFLWPALALLVGWIVKHWM